MRAKAKGFTLIEVLIAGSIMFIVLVMVTDSFLTARKSARHADNIIAMLQPLPLVKADILQQLQQIPGEPATGQGAFGAVTFQWRAEKTAAAAPKPRFELESGTSTLFAERFYLYQIELTLAVANQQKILTYTELVWRQGPGVPQ